MSVVHISAAAKSAGLSLDEYKKKIDELETQGEVTRMPGGYLLFVTPEQRLERKQLARERAARVKLEALEEKQREKRERELKIVIAIMKTDFSTTPARACDVAMSLSRTTASTRELLEELVSDGRLVKTLNGYLLPFAARVWQQREEHLELVQNLEGSGVIRR